MDRMAAKGLLRIQKIRNLQLFSATIDKSKARKGEFRKMLDRAFNGAVGPMMQYLVENEELSQEDMEQLRKLIQKTEHSDR
jgi:predicted transcriptional regulator